MTCSTTRVVHCHDSVKAVYARGCILSCVTAQFSRRTNTQFFFFSSANLTETLLDEMSETQGEIRVRSWISDDAGGCCLEQVECVYGSVMCLVVESVRGLGFWWHGKVLWESAVVGNLSAVGLSVSTKRGDYL